MPAQYIQFFLRKCIHRTRRDQGGIENVVEGIASVWLAVSFAVFWGRFLLSDVPQPAPPPQPHHLDILE